MADLDSRASRQGNAIAGLEASARPAFLGVCVWKDRDAFCCFVACEEVAVEECRAKELRRGLGRLEAVRAAATIFRVDFMVVYMRMGN